MAVIEDIGVGISIRVNEEALPEHDDPGYRASRDANGTWICRKYIEAIDNAEDIIYVSPQNELLFDRSGNDKPLLLVVTANHETNVFTIWSAAYLEPKSISASRKHNVPLPITKSRRRSSYGATAPGTGATTPAIRGADRFRESFGGKTRSKTQPPSFKEAALGKGRLTDEAVEEALASQLKRQIENHEYYLN